MQYFKEQNEHRIKQYSLVKKIIILSFLVFLLCNVAIAHRKDTLQSANLKFIENKNQWVKEALFGADVDGGMLFIEKNRLTFNLVLADDVKHSHAHNKYTGTKNSDIIHYHAYQIEFMNCKDAKIKGIDQAPDYCNYFIGKDKNKWASHAHKYSIVDYKGLYDKINLQIYSSKTYLKYDFIVEPQGDINNIKLNYKGADGIKISNDNLVIKTSVNDIVEMKPYAYQIIDGQVKDINCAYQLDGTIVSFKVDDYDKNVPLVIDPTVIFATYTGSTTDNWGFSATYDLVGDVYSGGIVNESGYPASIGAYQTTNLGLWDVAIIKYDSLGLNRKFATYLGGTECEMPHSLIVNRSNQLLIFGTTGSPDFPVTPNAYDTTFNGGPSVTYDQVLVYPFGSDIFVSKLSTDGDQLLASTFIGGTDNDGLNFRDYYAYVMMDGNDSLYANYADGARGEIITDNLNNVYIGSCTFSTDFPVSTNAFQQTNHGKQEGVVFKLDDNLSNLLWSSYLGGSGDDAIYSIDNDANNDVYVTGGTNSSDYHCTPGAFKTTFQGGSADAFVAHISQNGSTLVASSYYGSPNYDQAYFVRTSKDNYVYIYGQTKAASNTLIYNAAYNVPNSGQFIAKFNSTLDSLKMSTVFGTGNGVPNISPSAFAIDVCNRIYAAGWGRCWGGYSVNYPWGSVFGTVNMQVTANAYQPTTDGQDFYMMVLGPNAATLDYATFYGELHSASSLGNDHVDGGTSKFDKKGYIYQSVCASCGGSDAFPTYPNPGAWSNTNNSYNCNNAVIKFNLNNDFAIADFLDPQSSCAPDTVYFVNTSNGATYIWDFGDGSPTTTQANPTHIYTHSGIYNIKLITSIIEGCRLTDTLVKQFVVLSDTTYPIADVHICKGDLAQIGIQPTSDPTILYEWIPTTDITDPTIANPIAGPLVTTDYCLVITKKFNTCKDTLKQKVIVYQLNVDAGNDTLTCLDSVKLTAHITSGPVSYYWSSNANFSDTLNTNYSDSSVIAHFTTPTYFYVMIKNQWCQGIDSVHVGFGILNNPVNKINPTCYDSCNGQATIIPSGGIPPYTYQWSNGATTATVTGLCAGTYTVTVYDVNMCKSISTITLTQPTPLLVSHAVVNVPCSGVCIGTITETVSGGTAPYFFLCSNGETISPFINLCPDTYKITITDNNHCVAHDSADILVQSVFLNAKAWADQDTIYKDLSTTLHVTHTSGATYLWTPSNTLSSSTSPDPTAGPSITTTYYVVMTDQWGCTKTDSVTIYVIEIDCMEPYIYVPNAFTPNGDGKNDLLFVRGEKQIENLKFSIFDRWGEKVFETDNKHIPWDGIYNGKMCQPGVFVYYLEATCYNRKTFTKQGNITLIR